VDHLWAPWRMSYVSAEQPGGCIFCSKPASPDGDEANQIVYRGDLVFIMLNAFPYNSGHLLVAPFRHVADPLDLDPQESSELLYSIRVAITALKTTLRPEGFNIGANFGRVAGAGYADHLHLFMAVAANTRVVPEALADTYRRLKDALAQQSRDATDD
jgi:ATP adenylyltransferase